MEQVYRRDISEEGYIADYDAIMGAYRELSKRLPSHELLEMIAFVDTDKTKGFTLTDKLRVQFRSDAPHPDLDRLSAYMQALKGAVAQDRDAQMSEHRPTAQSESFRVMTVGELIGDDVERAIERDMERREARKYDNWRFGQE